MKIGNLSLNFGQIKPVNFSGNANTKRCQATEQDTFVKSCTNTIPALNSEDNPFGGQMSNKTYIEAKEAVLKSLKGEPPKESAVLIQNDKIVHFEEGKERRVDIKKSTIENFAQNSSGKIIFIHSHPDTNKNKGALPLSLTDFLSLYTNDNLDAFCSIDIRGDYSILKKNPDFEPDFEKLSKIYHRFNIAMTDAFKGEEKEEYKKFLQEEEKMLNGENVNVSELLEKGKYYSEIFKHKDLGRLLDNFWRNCAEEYNLEYSSSYSF